MGFETPWPPPTSCKGTMSDDLTIDLQALIEALREAKARAKGQKAPPAPNDDQKAGKGHGKGK